MLGYKDNIVVATHILAQAGRMAPVADRPLAAFVASVSKAYLKSKDTRRNDIMVFCEAVGKASFVTIIDKLTTKEAVDLLGRVDPHSVEDAKANPAWARARLVAVLTGEEAPETHDVSKSMSRILRRSRTRLPIPRSVVGETDAFSAKRRKRTSAIV
jgi:hypothetical protein